MKKTICMILVCVVLLTVLATAFTGAYASSDSMRAEIIARTNAERRKANLDNLLTTDALNQAAQKRAEEMNTAGSLSHVRPDGSSCFTVLGECGVVYSYTAENIAKGYQTAEGVLAGWMNETDDRANILSSKYTHMGVGVSGYYYVQLFIKSPKRPDDILIPPYEVSATVAPSTADPTMDEPTTVASTDAADGTEPSTPSHSLPYGDVNQDGKMNSTDALLILKYAVHAISLSDEEQQLADVTGNQKINSTDALFILKYAVQLIPQFPVVVLSFHTALTVPFDKR